MPIQLKVWGHCSSKDPVRTFASPVPVIALSWRKGFCEIYLLPLFSPGPHVSLGRNVGWAALTLIIGKDV